MRSSRTITISSILLSLLVIAGNVQAQQRATQYSQMKERPRLLFDKWSNSKNMGEGRSITPRERFEAMPISRRSTFAAATNALLYTRLTDPKGRPLGFAIDLVDSLEEIAGQEVGKGSDEQFRLYVKLKPGAIDKLELSKEFQHGKDNTIFHKGFPINYRQAGSPPTMQYSIATDGDRADIDVDYRSSAFPSALFNGHLSASNSDVRAAGNYPTHLRRWPGLVDWWDTEFPDLVKEFVNNVFAQRPISYMPATGSSSAPGASEVSETADAFFRVWLLDRDVAKALSFLQQKLKFCSDLKESPEKQMLEARRKILFLDTLKAANKELKKPKKLEDAIRAIAPVDPFIKPVEHYQKSSFMLATITDGDYDHFVCSSKTSEVSSKDGEKRARTYGKYYITKFQFILGNGKGGILRLMWGKENGSWKIEAFDAVTA